MKVFEMTRIWISPEIKRYGLPYIPKNGQAMMPEKMISFQLLKKQTNKKTLNNYLGGKNI